jgi:hypothetical protein
VDSDVIVKWLCTCCGVSHRCSEFDKMRVFDSGECRSFARR